MTLATSIEKHKEFLLLPVFVIVFDQRHKELVIELGLIHHTLTIKIK
jgi:hypothetical protein